MSDKYDEAIEWLVAHADDPIPEDYRDVYDGQMVHFVWSFASDIEAERLFSYATKSGGIKLLDNDDLCGCLTQIREGSAVGETPELTAAIRADERIPSDIAVIAKLRGDELRAALQPFAFWQRRLDREIRGVAAT